MNMILRSKSCHNLHFREYFLAKRVCVLRKSSTLAELFIKSVKDPKLTQIKSLREKSAREESNLVLIEGHRLFIECILAGLIPQELFLTQRAFENPLGPKVLSFLSSLQAKSVHYISEEVATKISETVHSQGLIASFIKPSQPTLSELFSPPSNQSSLILLMDSISDPGNLGTLIRTSHALGVTGIIVPHDSNSSSCDVWSGKCLRSSMGSSFRIPIAQPSWLEIQTFLSSSNISSQDLPQILLSDAFKSDQPISLESGNDSVPSSSSSSTSSEVDRDSSRSIVSSSSNYRSYYDVDLTLPTLLVLGSEARGLSENARSLLKNSNISTLQKQLPSQSSSFVYIPMISTAESLNVGVAGGIILAEAHRQRSKR